MTLGAVTAVADAAAEAATLAQPASDQLCIPASEEQSSALRHTLRPLAALAQSLLSSSRTQGLQVAQPFRAAAPSGYNGPHTLTLVSLPRPLLQQLVLQQLLQWLLLPVTVQLDSCHCWQQQP